MSRFFLEAAPGPRSGTEPTQADFCRMGDDAGRFRKRAHECRELAARAKDAEWRRWLLTLADDLESEAANVDAEESS